MDTDPQTDPVANVTDPALGSPETGPGPLAELPPVEPPSARFIVQLFVVPFVIVVVLVTFLLLIYTFFGRLATGGRDPGGYVEAIRSGNENRRWRAAYELASLIHNDDRLARDPELLGALTGLLHQELERRELAGAPNSDLPRVAQYLALTIGAFQTLEARDEGRAVDPIATLTDAIAPGRPDAVRAAAATSISRQLARPESRIEPDKVLPALTEAAEADEPTVRAASVYALGYLDDDRAKAKLAEALRDPDRDIRYNAAVALARLDVAKDLSVLREMLSTPDLEAVYESDLRDRPDEARRRIEAIQLEALLSLQDAVDSGKTQTTRALRVDLAKLTRSERRPVGVEATNLLGSLQDRQKPR